MGLFHDRRDRRDLSLKVCWMLAVWLIGHVHLQQNLGKPAQL